MFLEHLHEVDVVLLEKIYVLQDGTVGKVMALCFAYEAWLGVCQVSVCGNLVETDCMLVRKEELEIELEFEFHFGFRTIGGTNAPLNVKHTMPFHFTVTAASSSRSRRLVDSLTL